MLSPDEQLEIWWESLSADRREAVLEVDPNADPPGWIVASVAAANVVLDESPATDDAEDIKAHLPQLIQEFVAKKQKRGE
jgi:hypothetical protein